MNIILELRNIKDTVKSGYNAIKINFKKTEED